MSPPMDSGDRFDRDIEKQAEIDKVRLSGNDEIYLLLLKTGTPDEPNDLEQLTTEIRGLTSAVYYLAQLIREKYP